MDLKEARQNLEVGVASRADAIGNFEFDRDVALTITRGGTGGYNQMEAWENLGLFSPLFMQLLCNDVLAPAGIICFPEPAGNM